MKITNTRTMTLALLWLGANLVMQPSAQAQDGLGKVVGTAWTIGNAIVGETTLTPAYAISSWYQHQVVSTPYQFGNNNVTRKVRRDMFGVYFYDTKIVIDPADPFPHLRLSTNAFPVDSMNKLNMTCYYLDINPITGATNLITNTIVQTHTEVVWLDTVVRTGLWPDNGPWTVWLKTGGYPTGCSAPPPTPNYYYWVPASIALGGGYVTVSLGTPNCIQNYPFYLASDFYK